MLGTGERGRFLLAATFGNVTAYMRRATSSCARGLLGDRQAALASARPTARFAYVFHGSSGSSPDDVRDAIAAGVVKVNLDTDAQYAFTCAVAGHVLAHDDGVLKVDGGIGRKADYDPRSWDAKQSRRSRRTSPERPGSSAQAGRSVLRTWVSTEQDHGRSGRVDRPWQPPCSGARPPGARAASTAAARRGA